MSVIITSRQSQVIDWLRFPLAAAVVLLHAGESTTGLYDMDFSGTLRIALSQGICRIAVPCFFLFSGFLFFTKLENWDTQVWLDKIRKRGRTLLVPYLIWNILALLVGFGYGWLRSRVNPVIVPESLLETLQSNGWLNIFWASTYGCPVDYPLWFIRNLILFVAASPLVWLLARKCRFWGAAVLFVAFGLTGSRDLEGLFYFVLGACFQLSSVDFLQVFARAKWPAYLLSLAGIVLIARTYREDPQAYRYIKYLFVLCGTVSVVNLAAGLLDSGRVHTNAFLSSSSFFVYASHAILILHDFAHYITLHLLPFTSVAGKSLALFVKAGLAVAMCLLLFAGMKKWTPKTLGVLTGNRF